MNVLFFLIPKSEIACLKDNQTLAEALELLEKKHYTAVPVLNNQGHYVGTLTEGDILRVLADRCDLNLNEARRLKVWQIPRRWEYAPVNINATLDTLVEAAMAENFVPVVDDLKVFIGIITRRQIIEYLYRKMPS